MAINPIISLTHFNGIVTRLVSEHPSSPISVNRQEQPTMAINPPDSSPQQRNIFSTAAATIFDYITTQGRQNRLQEEQIQTLFAADTPSSSSMENSI